MRRYEIRLREYRALTAGRSVTRNSIARAGTRPSVLKYILRSFQMLERHFQSHNPPPVRSDMM